MSEDNPFEVLGLDPATAGEEEAVRRAALLCQKAADEPTRNRVRQAIGRLTASPEAWALWAMLTHPGPVRPAAELERLVQAFRRPPAAPEAAAVPGLDLEEFRDLLRQALAADLELPPQQHLEAVEVNEGADEVNRQTAEVLWQALVVDARG